ncbi:MAG: hypothetical protein Q8Q09_21380 [Deltaproteobacteria bacterium]|nr:hypothetical protein [Deltaproteobacteria bacterium]
MHSASQLREWNPQQFFRHLSEPLFSRFCLSRQLWIGVDGPGPRDAQVWRAWKALAPELRLALERELLPINDLCSPHARPYLEDLARCVWLDGAPERAAILHTSTPDLAMMLHLAAPQALQSAHRRYAVDMLEHCKEYVGRAPLEITCLEESKSRMKTAMSEHFAKTLGSDRCHVEDYEDGEKLALFIYHEGALEPDDRFDSDGVLLPVWTRPVVRVAAVFFRTSNTLLVKTPRASERELLRDLFARSYVGRDDYFVDPGKRPRFSFAPLRRPAFDFAVAPDCDIDAVFVTSITLRGGPAKIRRIQLYFARDATLDQVHNAVYDLHQEIDPEFVEAVRLRFVFRSGSGRARERTVTIANPNTTNLRDTPRDRVIRNYLALWGFDVRNNHDAVGLSAA